MIALHQILYTPAQWATFATDTFFDFYQQLVKASGSNLALATRSTWALPELKRDSDQSWPDFTFHAIACGDSIDESNVTSQAVFNEFIRVVKDVSPMCESSYCDQYSFQHPLTNYVQSASNSLNLAISATDGPLVLWKGTPVHGTAP